MEEMFYISHADIWTDDKSYISYIYLDGVEPLHQQFGDFQLFVVLSLSHPQLSLGLAEKASVLMRKTAAFVNQQSTTGTLFIPRPFLQNIPMGPRSLSVTSHYAGKACQRQTLYVIGPICKVRRK